MGTIYRCDICGKEMERIEGKMTLRLNEIEVKFAALQAFGYSEEDVKFDLCEDCYKKIKQNLNNNTIERKSDSCYTCRYHKSCNPDEYPCSQCSHNYTSQYEHE